MSFLAREEVKWLHGGKNLKASLDFKQQLLNWIVGGRRYVGLLQRYIAMTRWFVLVLVLLVGKLCCFPRYF